MEINLSHYLKGEERERKINRFSVSELYYLLQGWTTIEEYVNGQKRTMFDYWTMQLGSLKHEWIQEHLKTLGYECEVKKVYEVDGLEIVGRADALKADHGLEIKTGKARDKASQSQLYQARMYCSMFELPEFYIVQPYINKDRAYLKTIGVAKRNDKWFLKEIEKIKLKFEEIKLWKNQHYAQNAKTQN